jgi:hypothetical protein
MQQLDIHAANEISGGMNTIPGSMLVTIVIATLICADGPQNK